MRRFVKRMAAAVLLSACLVSLSGCSSNQDTAETDSTISMDGTPVDDSMAQSIMLSAAQTLGVPKDQLIVQKTLAESTGDTTTAAIYEAQLEVREDMGELKNVNMDEGSVVLLADGSYTVVIPVDFTEGTKKYVMNINMATQQIQAEFTDYVRRRCRRYFYGCSVKDSYCIHHYWYRHCIPCFNFHQYPDLMLQIHPCMGRKQEESSSTCSYTKGSSTCC